MAGNIKVGGNTIFTHTGAVGAGTVTLKDQSGNAILTDNGTAVSMGNLRLPATGGIKDSSGNNILTESGGNVSIGDMRLPATGGIKDSSGNDVLSEASGTVTLANVNLSSSVGHGYTTILQKDFTLSNGTNTQLNYTSGEIIDDLGWHSTSTNTDRITVDRDGIYLVTLNCFDIDAINRVFITANHFSSSASLIDVISQDITTDTDSIDDLSLSGIFKMDANSFVQCVAYQLHGSNRTAEFTFTLTLIKEL